MTPSVYQGIIRLDWYSGCEVTSQQPKGVDLDIKSHADYIYIQEVTDSFACPDKIDKMNQIKNL